MKGRHNIDPEVVALQPVRADVLQKGPRLARGLFVAPQFALRPARLCCGYASIRNVLISRIGDERRILR
jgi:hypothetical protein